MFQNEYLLSAHMKTGLGLIRKYRLLYAYLNLLKFWLKKKMLGFDVANQFIQRVDKTSLQLILKINGAKIGKNCDIETGLIFHNCLNYNNLTIGNNCHIGKNCFFDLRDRIIIKNNVVISMQCTFITHLDMNKSPLRNYYPCHSQQLIIGDNTYLGVSVKIIRGIIIGSSVIIAAGSVVNKSISNNILAGGVPAKPLRKIVITNE